MSGCRPPTRQASGATYASAFWSRWPAFPDFVPIEGAAADLEAETARLNALLKGRPVDLCFAGIGENATPPLLVEMEHGDVSPVDLGFGQMREHFELTGARDDDNRGAAVGGPARP